MTMHPPKEPSVPVMAPMRRVSAKLAILAGLLAAYLSTVFALRRFGHLSSDGSLGLQFGLGLGLIAAVRPLCFRWWRHKDEAQREAQKWAWYWGGAVGLVTLPPIVFIMTFDGDHMLNALLAAIGSVGDAGAAFKLGIAATLIPMLAAAFVARAVWWRRRR